MKMKKTGHKTRHDENLARLARIEGQVKGIQRMVEEGAYCVDIITQIQAAQSALGAVGRKILEKHIDHCVVDTMKSKSKSAANKKIEELMKVLKRSCG
ncbi:metal-sensitive transcriptional regulator [Verrucomicrobiota bacterium]